MRVLVFLLLFSITAKSQTSYSGYLNNKPITLIMYHYNNGDTYAYYAYNKLISPIKINGTLKNGTLSFIEKNDNKKNTATIVFNKFKETDKRINGQWVSADTSITYKISLKKDFDINYGANFKWKSREVLQSKTTTNNYFKTIITKEKGRFHGKISGVKIFDKSTNKLIQTITLDCLLLATENVSVGDYNFDGLDDFSVLENISTHDSNTSSIYILQDKKSKKYTVSSFKGTSLEFDNNLNLVYSKNQCCEGHDQIHTTYKVVNNEMVEIEKKCLKYNYKNNTFIEVKCKQHL